MVGVAPVGHILSMCVLLQVCDQLDVPLSMVPLTNQYWERVVSHCVDEIRNGRTPNPDVLCNSRVKFGAFFEYLNTHEAEFDRVASGHYARVDRINSRCDTETANEDVSGRFLHHACTESTQPEVFLSLTPDTIKDQTYFLASLSQKQLQTVLFPLGSLTKAEVRDLAQRAQLPTMQRKDSQGICFLGKVKFNEFIKVLLYYPCGFPGMWSLKCASALTRQAILPSLASWTLLIQMCNTSFLPSLP